MQTSAPPIICRGRRGATVVELSVILPVLIILLAAGVEFSRLVTLRHVVDNASYEAARHVIVPGATVEEARAAAEAVLRRFGVSGATITTDPSVIDDATHRIAVRVEIAAHENSWFLSHFAGNSRLAAVTSLLSERSPMVQVKALPVPPPPPPPPAAEEPVAEEPTAEEPTAEESTAEESTEPQTEEAEETSSLEPPPESL